MYEVCMSADSRVEPDFSQDPQKWIGEAPASLGAECLMYEENNSSSTNSLLIKSGFLVLFTVSIYTGYQFLKQTSAHPQLASTQLSVDPSNSSASKSIGEQLAELENQTKSIREIDLTTTGSIKKTPAPISKPTPIKPQITTDAKIHVVQPGDTLSAIGRKFKIKTAEIMELNAIENVRLIKPGMKLIVSR